MLKMNGLFIDQFGNKEYYLNGVLHRTDGPAFESNNQNQEFWINGIEFCEECYWKEIKK
jgi:hypothetical protein